MADLLRIKAVIDNNNALSWEFLDDKMGDHKISLDQKPAADIIIEHNDVWQVELITRKRAKVNQKPSAVVRLVAREQKLADWHSINELKNFYLPKTILKKIIIWLHEGENIVLIGPKGNGKTTLPYKIAEALKWQQPCKVDVGTIKKGTDMFGVFAAKDGSTYFVRSAAFDYIERAVIAHQEGLNTHFLLILDEINRVHAKIQEPLHGLFDDTNQITLITPEGSKVIWLPPNLHVIGTMNTGANYVGTFKTDEAVKDRFAAVRVPPMPEDYEAKRLADETGIPERFSYEIVKVARRLREAADGQSITFSPSYRGCRMVAKLVRNGFSLQEACEEGFLGWYEGELQGSVTDPGSEVGKALSALRAVGINKTLASETLTAHSLRLVGS